MKPTLPEPEVLDRHLPTNTPITRGYTWKTVQRLIDEAYAAGMEDAANIADLVANICLHPGEIGTAIRDFQEGS